MDQIYDAEGKHPASKSVICSHWGLSPKGSTALVTLAAIKRFGLLDEIGGGKNKQYRLSDRALRIRLESDPEKRRADIREAALEPSIHRELWEEFDGELPSDANLKSNLVLEKDFSDGGAEDFLKQYRETLAFAGLNESSSMEPSGDKDDDPDKVKTTPPEAFKVRPSKGEARVEELPLPLTRGTAILKFPYPMSNDDFNWLKAMLERLKDRIVGPDEGDRGDGPG